MEPWASNFYAKYLKFISFEIEENVSNVMKTHTATICCLASIQSATIVPGIPKGGCEGWVEFKDVEVLRDVDPPRNAIPKENSFFAVSILTSLKIAA